MNPDRNEFDALRKILVIKRYEQPPPGYFDRLPQQILARLQTEPEPGFFQRLFPNLSFRPAYAYAFGFVVCGSLVLAINYSLNSESPQIAAQPPNDAWKLGHAPAVPILAVQGSNMLTIRPVAASALASTNPVTNPQEPKSLFDGLQLKVQPASY